MEGVEKPWEEKVEEEEVEMENMILKRPFFKRLKRWFKERWITVIIKAYDLLRASMYQAFSFKGIISFNT